MGFAILQIGGRELFFAVDEIVNALGPKGFEIEQMTGLLLGGPFFAAACDEAMGRYAAQEFFEARGSATQADAEIGIEVDGKVKFEFSFKPLAGVAHKESVAGVKESQRESNAAHTGSGRTNWLRCGERR